MLTLPTQGKWFRMLLSGEKKEEYRKLSGYYASRLEKYAETGGRCVFRNGYSALSPSFEADFTVRKGTGRPEWGAEPGKEYYVLSVSGIGNVRNCGTETAGRADG